MIFSRYMHRKERVAYVSGINIFGGDSMRDVGSATVVAGHQKFTYTVHETIDLPERKLASWPSPTVVLRNHQSTTDWRVRAAWTLRRLWNSASYVLPDILG